MGTEPKGREREVGERGKKQVSNRDMRRRHRSTADKDVVTADKNGESKSFRTKG